MSDHTQIASWNDTLRHLSPQACLHELVAAQAVRTPRAVAVVADGESVTYAELVARANQLAHQLREWGVGPDTIVGLCVERGVGMVVGILGILSAGGAYLPLDPDYPTERLRYIVDDGGALVVLAQPATADRVGPTDARICLVEDGTEFADQPVTAPPSTADLDNLAYVIYTSGSTGRPKGVSVPHRGVVNRVLWGRETYPIDGSDAMLHKTPYSFDVSVWEFFWPLVSGARLVMAAPGGHRDPDYIARTIAAERITAVHFVPTMLAQFLAHPHTAELSSVRQVFCSGEALQPEVVERAHQVFDARLHNLYGPTEASIEVSQYECRAGATPPAVPIGAPIANTVLYVLDENMRHTAIDQPGELHIGGLPVVRGYHGNPALTSQRFVADPFPGREGRRLYRTGDLACWRHDGNIEYLGRIDDQVKIRGFRIELGEIEGRLLAHEPIDQAAVIVREDAPGDRRLAAYIVLVNGETSNEIAAGLREFLETDLPEYMIPPTYTVLDALPLTSSGKLDRASLPVPAVAEASRAVYEFPSTPTEKVLCTLMAEIVRVDRVGLSDDFFDLGGDSILALQLAAKAHAAGLPVTAAQVITHRSVGQIAAAVDAAPEAPSAPVADSARALAVPAADRDRVLSAAPSAADVEDIYPLTPMQAGMLFHSLYATDSRAYFQQSRYAADGVRDVQAFADAWRQVAARHPSLRSTVFYDGLERPVQVVHRDAEFSVSREDWSMHGPDEIADRLECLLDADRRAGFDLVGAPPLRLTLIVTGPDTVDVVLTYHHLILDGWSLSNLAAEVVQAYEALVSGASPSLPPVVPYRRYVEWHAGQDPDRAEEFWRDKLDGVTAATSIVLDDSTEPAQPAADDDLACVAIDVPASLSERMTQYGRGEGITTGTLLHAAWGLLLSRYSGDADVIFGSTVSGRPPELEGIDDIVGMCINTLPVRMQPDPAICTGDWLRLVQADLLELRRFEHSALAEITALTELRRGSRLFDSIVIVENYPAGPAADTGVTLRPGPTIERTGYPLVLVALNHGGALRLELRYQPHLFARTAVERMSGHLGTLLRGLVEDADMRLGTIGMLDTAAAGQPAPTPSAAADTLHEWFAATAKAGPDATAVDTGTEQITYAELDRRANQLANYLRDHAVVAETPVGICLRRHVDMVVAMLATMKAGGTYIPLAPDNPRERLAQIADDARVRVLLTETELDGLVDVGEATTLLVDADRDLVGGYPSDPPPAVTGHDNLAYIIYTSGSTGRPKGVACHHRGLVNYLAGAVAAYACRGTGGAPVFSSFGFDMIVPDLYVPLLMGQTVHLLPDPLEPADLGAELARRAPFAFIKMTPGHLQLLAEQLTPDQARGLAGTLVVGADSFHAATLARWRELDPETVVLNEYGPTEASVANSTYRTGDADLIPGSADVLPIGTPVPNTTLYVLDRELNPVPSGVTGEIYIGGTCCARGYLGRAAQTAQRFVPDPFIGRPGAVMYRTGDLGKWRADGNLRFVDRSDRQVKLRGYRIEPGEVEARLVEHPAVHQARCVVRTDGATVRLAAYVVLGTDLDTDIGDDELPDWCARRLPSYMVPATFTTIDTLPLDPNGKVDERRLPAPGESAGAAKPGSLAPRTDLERRLLQVWIDVLKRDDIGVRDNFFDLGGDSILSIQLIAAGRRAGLRLTPKQIFGHPTIEALAAHVTEFVAAPGAAAAAEPGDGRTPLSPIQRWLTAQRLPHAEHYNQSVLIDFDAADAGRLQRALDAVVDRHDALRQRFVDDDTFCAVGERGDSVPVDEVDLTEVADATESRRRAEQTANAAQAALDLATGRLVRAVVFRHGPNRSDQVLIVVHHLAVDNLSWPTILDTLKAAYDEQPLPDSGSTFAEWGRRIQDVEAFASQHDYWYSALDDAAEVPVDHRDDDRADTVESTDVVTVALSAAETDALLHDGPLAYHMRVEDVFVTGLAQVFSGWMDSDDVVIDLESHGREQLHEDLDISRTVGWFTSAYPVRLTLPSRGDRDTDLAQALKSVKDTLRAVPDSGIGYGVLRRLDAGAAGRRLRTLPEPSIVVNYTGRTESSASPFDMAAQTLGAERAGDQPRSHTIELEAAVRDGVLEVAWTYSHNRHERGTVERLANGHLDRLRALVAHCQAHPGGHTPGDFPLARLDFEELDQLLADAPDIADIYPLTPLQEGMLFHALLSPETGDNYSQEVFVLEGDVDADVVERACRAAAARHPAMRTTIVWDGLSKPMQVVHASSELDVRRLDWSEHDPAAWSDEIDALLAAERADIPDLETAPPIRVTLIRDSATKCRLVLSFHHILLDGWSVHVLMSEIAAIYWALSRGEEPRLPAATPYQRFVESIAHEDTGPARAFWAGMLDGYVPPAQLPEVLAGPQPGGSDAFESDASESEVASVRATLDADDSAALRELAGQSRFTVNTVALAAWAMLLANYSRADDVVVGVSVSGRPVGLSGAASMVGLLSNTLPVRAMMGVGESVEQLLTRLQSMQLDMREFESSSLADIQTTAGIQRGSRLFESIFVFESSILATPEDDASNLRLTLDRAIESTGYPLNVIVRDDDCLEVKVLYQPGRVSEDGASRLVADLVAVLTGLATSLRRPVADFVDLVSVG